MIGYSLVVHSLLIYWISGAFTTAGLNVWIPAFIGMYGWDRSAVLMMGTIGSLIGVIGTILFGRIVSKRSPRIVMVICLIGYGITILLFGHITNLVEYLLCLTSFNFFFQGFCNICSNTVIGNWFPRQKGFVLGITTIGLPMAACLFVPILRALYNGFGLMLAFTFIGIAVLIFAVVSIFWVKDNPEQVGLLPDNGKFADDVEMAKEEVLPEHTWTIRKVLTNRNAWLIGIVYGILFLCTQGFISQTTTYLQERGFSEGMSVMLLSITSAIGIGGSFVWGIIDGRIGAKRTTIIYCAWYVVTFVVLFINGGAVLCIIGCVLLGSSMGGIGNLGPSMILEAYGPRDFPGVSTVIQTVIQILRSLCFFVMGLGWRLFGGYRLTSLMLAVFIVIALICIICVRVQRPDRTKADATT